MAKSNNKFNTFQPLLGVLFIFGLLVAILLAVSSSNTHNTGTKSGRIHIPRIRIPH